MGSLSLRGMSLHTGHMLGDEGLYNWCPGLLLQKNLPYMHLSHVLLSGSVMSFVHIGECAGRIEGHVMVLSAIALPPIASSFITRGLDDARRMCCNSPILSISCCVVIGTCIPS